MNIYSFLTDAASAWPSKPAVIFNGGTLTFEMLLQRANELRERLSQVGLSPGTGLALVATDGPDFIIGLFAGLGCGAVVMPLSPDLKQQEFHRALESVPVAMILHDGSLNHDVEGQEPAGCGAMRILQRPAEFHHRVASAVPEAAVIRFTSGTTGRSKGVVLSHRTVCERSAATIEGLELKAGQRVTWVLPMAYHFIVSILTYIRAGICTVIPQELTAGAVIDATLLHRSDLLYASPTIIQMLAEDQSTKQLPPDLRVTSTSSQLSHAHASAFTHRFGLAVEQLYGLIEVGLPLRTRNFLACQPGDIGKPAPGYEAATLSERHTPVQHGEIGKLAVRGPGMFDAYLSPFRPRADVVVDGWFLTGDLAIQSEEGSFVVRGREKSLIIIEGEKVFPEEIEGVLLSFPGVKAARAYRVGSEDQPESIDAEIVTSQTAALDITALRAYCLERLSAYKVPSEIRVVSELPVTPSGKIVRAG